MGIPLVASDAQTTGTITLADASAVVYGDDGIEVRSSDVAAIQLDDAATNQSAPTTTATALVDCFSTNTRAVAAEQRIAVRVGDTNAVATLTGIQWGVGDSSPAGT